jgi:predicted aldo/keto reductase-like oxidoreductase
MDRRTFLVTSVHAAAWLRFAHAARAGSAGERRGQMLYRPLGTTGATVSAIGLGGYHLGAPVDEKTSLAIVRTAIDRGVTFLDNCWDYHDGDSERRMGKALQDGWRERVFLMTKIDGRTAKLAAEQIEESLRRLRTDRVDLLQIHEVIRHDDPDRVFAPGGAMEAMRAAQKAGKARFLGFTGHKDPAIHLKMLDVAARHGFRFDAVQMPLNVMDAHFRSFERDVLPRLVRDGVGVLGMKSLGSGVLLESGVVTATECLQYALNLPTSTVITGIDEMPVLEQAVDAVATFQPMSREQVAALLARTAPAAAGGRYELFKTADRFDATARHPEWLG